MAAKKRRTSPLDDPPTASSSDEEEEEAPKPSQQQPKEDEADEEGQSSSDDSGEEDESEEEDEENQPSVLSQSSAKNPPPPPPTKSQPKPSSSESESGTDSDSDEEDDPNSEVKPLASKPMDQNPNYKTKAQTETPSSPPPNKSGTKRATENNNAHANDSKRAKKKGTDTAVPAASAGGSDDEMETEEDVKKSGEDSKKLFQRVWSEEDEITIVKSMLDFISKSGNDPLKYIAVFYDFVKKSLSFEATSTQLKHKIRRIKDKYNVAAQKARNNGVDPNFSKPRDQKLYDLSKKVWGKDSNEVEEKGKSNGRTPKSPKKEASAKNTTSARKPARTKKAIPEASEETELPEQVVALKGESDKEVALSEMFRHDKGNSIPGLNEAVVHRGLDFMDESKKAVMAAKWKEYRADEFKMFMRRTDLVREHAALVWEAYQASNP